MNGPKRVLISTDAVGGIWAYTVELARALSRRRVEVELAVLGPPPMPAQERAVAALYGVTLHDTGLPLDWTAPEPGVLNFISAALATLARARDVDLVQLHTPALVAQSIWSAPVMAMTHSDIGTWWGAVRGGTPAPETIWRMDAVRAGLKAADTVVAPTRALAAMIRQTYGTQRPIEIVHNGRATVAAAHVAPEDRAGVLVAGRLWDAAKNVTMLDRAADLMGDVPVRGAGPLHGPDGASLDLKTISALGVLDEAAMANAMAAARIFAAPALYEPFGLAVLEAAQSGLPLVLADIPSFRELWDGAAIFLPAADERAWADTLVGLYGKSAECRRWGMKARARATNYTIERFDGSMWDRMSTTVTPERHARAA